jgi:xanthine dehydrogenase accessory factor
MRLSAFLAAHPACVVVEIVEARGSTPREAGTVMLVAEAALWGTIGGGQLEYMAIDNAKALLSGAGGGKESMDIPLGPEIGQCCGGRTALSFQRMTPALAAGLEARMRQEDEARPSIMLFGAGHVGHALARALVPLPFAVTLVETRAEALEDLPADLETRLTPMPEAEVETIPQGGAVLILTHDHALDFLIAEKALARTDLAYVGMIGSATKRATFAHWLARQEDTAGTADAMLARLVLPVGGTLVRDKRPEVIAALVAAELLVTYAARENSDASVRTRAETG